MTVEAALRVSVHDCVFEPELEQAPDQIALRPFDTVSVIDVPDPNDAEAELPTGTLMLAGLELIRSPLRPDAVTVRVDVPVGGGGGGVALGLMVRTADRVMPPPETEIVTGVGRR